MIDNSILMNLLKRKIYFLMNVPEFQTQFYKTFIVMKIIKQIQPLWNLGVVLEVQKLSYLLKKWQDIINHIYNQRVFKCLQIILLKVRQKLLDLKHVVKMYIVLYFVNLEFIKLFEFQKLKPKVDFTAQQFLLSFFQMFHLNLSLMKKN